MRAAFITAILVLCQWQGLWAQTAKPDSVICKDRSFYLGFITEIAPFDTVYIRTLAGNSYAIPVPEIERVYIRRPGIGTPIDNGPDRDER